ncbi:MAG: DUF6145 family protein [Lachnospiraceae bacterium]|nr:DUF6145 family protein [Lachnospiraceae bacterium]
MADRVVLCGANSYEQKYYFNKDFALVPEEIQDEIHIICVMFTEEIGGIFTMVFDEDGSLKIETQAADSDYLYDEIGARLYVDKITRYRQDLFRSLEMFYRVFVLGEKLEDIEKKMSDDEDF